MNDTQIRHHLETLAGVQPSAEATDRALARVRQQLTDAQAPQAPGSTSFWRVLMKSPFAKLTAAAVIAVVAIIVLTQFSSTPAFAEVVQSLLQARTASFKMTMATEGAPTQNFDCLYAEPIRMRQTLEDGSAVVISNLQEGRIVTLVPDQNQAIVIEMENMPDSDIGKYNMFAQLRDRILAAQQDEDSAEFLGTKDIDGREVIGFHVTDKGVEITVWADAQTKLPVELTSKAGPATYTMTDISFNIDIDESLLSMDIPDGYTVRKMQMDASTPTEDDLIVMFGLWAQHADNTLPSTLGPSAPSEFMKRQMAKIMTSGQEPDEQQVMDLQQVIMTMGRGGMFVQQLPESSDWHYAGKDVTFGDAESPIFWYRPEGSQTYRVIYGDLHIVERPADQLPEIQSETSDSNG